MPAVVDPDQARAVAGRTVMAAVGAAAHLPGADVVLDLGGAHPSAHGALRLRLEVTDDVVTAAEPLVGMLHRGAEKLFEARDYRQVLMLANRHDWLSAFGSELGVALSVERLTGITPPERATWGRTLLAELSRVQAALLYLSTTGTSRADLPGHPGLAARESVLTLLEEATGNRIHLMANRIGGLLHDLPPAWLDRVPGVVDGVRAALPGLADHVDRLRPRTTGVAVLSRESAIAFGVSGPVARGSGLDLDLRRDDPYLAYAHLVADAALTVPGRTSGDAAARLDVLLEQTEVSLDLVTASARRLAALPPGPVNVRLPKTLRAPEGETYVWTEGVSGINGYYLVSAAEPTPWRLKIRSASFNNVQAMAAALPGTRVGDLPLALMSFLFVVGDIDR